MIGRSRAVATVAERGEDCHPDPLGAVDEPSEPARDGHDPVPDVVDHPHGGAIAIDVCRRCGTYAPRRDGVCRGRNRALDEFDEAS